MIKDYNYEQGHICVQRAVIDAENAQKVNGSFRDQLQRILKAVIKLVTFV